MCIRDRTNFTHNSRITKPGKTRPRVPSPKSAVSQKTDARLGRIVRLLSDNATVIVSGTKIAEEIGTTRSEIWRLIQQLRQLGVDVAGHPATGYQLRTVPDLLLPDILRPLVRGTLFGAPIHHFYKIGSTNT